ncbi:MAG: hypothetical protein ACR2H9_06000 [Longimicrobiaceae bacterium]
MSERPYKITVEGEGTKIEREINQNQLLQVLAVILGGGGVTAQMPIAAGVEVEDGGVSHTAPHPGAVRNRTADQTVGEFLSRCNAGSNAERIAGIALYLEEHLGEASITKDALPTWFRKAGLPIPKNFPRDIAQAVKRNLIAEEHDQDGQYFVTGTGKQHLRSRNGAA